MRKKVTIYTDGGCSPNPGPDGFGVILIYGESRREFNSVEFEWVRGHSGHPENERRDVLATAARSLPELLVDHQYKG